MNLDYGRLQDLEDLTKAIKEAGSQAQKDHLKAIMERILSQSVTVSSLRNDLIRASRVGDERTVKRLVDHIQRVRMEETAGHSWGNNKGNRKTNTW